VKIVEVPPGPPVLSTLVAEIYGPDHAGQIAVAAQVRKIMQKSPNVVDVDWFVEKDVPDYHIMTNSDKAALRGVSVSNVVNSMRAALQGMTAGYVNQEQNYEKTPIRLQLADSDKSALKDILAVKVLNDGGIGVPIGDLVTIDRRVREKAIYRKNEKEVVYVTADMAGALESPSYAISDISANIKSLPMPQGYSLREEYTRQPDFEDNYSVKWDGEWQITFEVFRDLGIAFVVVIILIYVLILGWFQNFQVPLIMLASIPLSLIGIVAGHWMLHAYFTATSMIGFIALAGVMVRNSILIVDFINIRLKDGIELKQAIIEAGAVRTTPILLTAGAVALGAVIILFDPIFQGLAISLMGGTITSTFLTLLIVPLLYFKMMRKSALPASA